MILQSRQICLHCTESEAEPVQPTIKDRLRGYGGWSFEMVDGLLYPLLYKRCGVSIIDGHYTSFYNQLIDIHNRMISN